MRDGQKRQKRHKRRRIGFFLFFLRQQTSAKHRRFLKSPSAVKNISVRDQQLHRAAWCIPGHEFVPAETPTIFHQLLHFPCLGASSHAGGGKKIKLKQKNRHAEDDDARPATR